MSGLLAVVALLFVSAFMFCTSGHRPDQTASNNTPSAAGGPVGPNKSSYQREDTPDLAPQK
jgi:hypothetical protein